ncbi:VWA domain-containing protein [Neptuniibacter sp.]|uniref:VWA domain-containing protein n=1 Tax=Neptuniibacter sp. TaxID=1962643 RepID=UPI003B5B5E20
MFDHFHFLQPYWLLLLPLLVALVVLTKRHSLNRSHWSKVCDPELLPFLEQQGSAKKSVGLPLIALIATALLVIAAAQPVWKQMPQPVFQKNDSVVIALDLSASMNATDLKPSRLQRARFKIKDLLARIPDAQVALIVYAADAFTVTPLTEDNDTILDQLPVMSPEIMPVQGSRADRALQKADQLLTQAGVATGNIVLVSDEVLPAQIAATASRLKLSGRQISILAVGTEQGAPIPKNGALLTDRQGNVVVAKTRLSEMQESAGLGGGSAVMITLDDRDVAYLVGGFQENDQLPAESTQQLNRWIAEGPWFVLLALPLLLPLFRKGILNLILPVCLGMGLVFPTDLYANPESEPESTSSLKQTWQNLWKTGDQQAYQLYQQGESGKAAERFNDLRWKQLAHYQNGEFEKALSTLEQPQTPADWYNFGNVLARLGDLNQAITAYDQALELQPEFEDATYNRQLLEEMLKRQQKESGEEGQQSDEHKGGQSRDPSQGSDVRDPSPQSAQGSNSPDQDSSGEGAEAGSSQNGRADNKGFDDQSEAAEQRARSNGSGNQAAAGDDTPESENEQQDSPQDREQMQQQLKDSIDQQLSEQKAQNSSQAEESAENQKQSAKGQTESGIKVHQPIDEQNAAREQLLNRIEDDPSGLWRRKFIYQYRQQAGGQAAEDKQW